MNKDVLISAILIVKNEEQHLVACLDTIKDWVSEIIILDSGSTDGTLKIAESYQAKVYQNTDWQGFGIQRQRAQRLASGIWCLWLDADERVTPELRQEIESVIAKPADNMGYSIPRLNWYFGRYIRHCGWYPKPVLRLYPRALTTYNDSYVHEKVIIPQEMTVKRLKGDLIHYPYKNLRHHVSKSSGYAHDWALAKYQKGKRTTLINAFLHSLARFCRMYFLQLGFLDGYPGFLLSIMSGYYTFLKYAELWINSIENKE